MYPLVEQGGNHLKNSHGAEADCQTTTTNSLPKSRLARKMGRRAALMITYKAPFQDGALTDGRTDGQVLGCGNVRRGSMSGHVSPSGPPRTGQPLSRTRAGRLFPGRLTAQTAPQQADEVSAVDSHGVHARDYVAQAASVCLDAHCFGMKEGRHGTRDRQGVAKGGEGGGGARPKQCLRTMREDQ